MARVFSFAPIARADARVLVLGSMPGEASLQAGQYYAHPHNAFWPIMGALFGAGRELDYDRRVARLRDAGVAVWDVLHGCERKGSLDAAIDDRTIEPNDFAAFFRAHLAVERVFFNGAKAEQVYRRRVLPGLPAGGPAYLRRPSTSPANASLDAAAKLDRWRVVAERWS